MTVPHITIEQAEAIVGKSLAEGWMEAANRMIEKTEPQYITAEEALETIKSLNNFDRRVHLTAAQAKSRGVGGAAFYAPNLQKWLVCGESFNYLDCFEDKYKQTTIKYRAIKQKLCDGAQSANIYQATALKQPDPLASLPEELINPETKKALGKWIDSQQPEPVEPTCQIRNDDTGDLKTMTREAAKLLQAELGDTVEWRDPSRLSPMDGRKLCFDAEGIYTYKLKGTVKLTIDDNPAKMLTPAQCETERLARIDTHDVAYWQDGKKQGIRPNPNWVDFDEDLCEYRLIRKQPRWTGSREDVIALLIELGVTK